jgi:hypothetical protein
VIGHVVYYSDLGTKTTAGLDIVTGKQVFAFPDGAFNQVIADNNAIYLDGYGQIYQLLPGRHRAGKAALVRRRQHRHHGHNAAARKHKSGGTQSRQQRRTASRRHRARAARRHRQTKAAARQATRRVRHGHNRTKNRK